MDIKIPTTEELTDILNKVCTPRVRIGLCIAALICFLTGLIIGVCSHSAAANVMAVFNIIGWLLLIIQSISLYLYSKKGYGKDY